MDINFPINPKELRRFNLIRYNGIPPSWELIESVIEKSGLKKAQRFECVWFMPRSTLTWYKNGEKPLPPKYWHIFYDFDIVNQMYSKLHKKRAILTNNLTSKWY